MLAIIISLLYFCIFLAAGQAISGALFLQERALIRLMLSGVFALLLLLWLPALASFLLGFTLLSQYVALALCVTIALIARRLSRQQPSYTGFDKERNALFILLPLFVLGVYLFFTHVLNPVDGALHSGQSTFGDLPLHLGLTTSITNQRAFPPQYSILPGTAVGYPFLCDSISATFLTLGAPLRFAMLLPSLLAYALVLLGAYCFFERWLKTQSMAILATLLFFVGGGFGFWYFVDLIRENPSAFSRIFTEFYNTPTNYTPGGLRWVNTIADMLIPQRATLFGWALLFPSLYLLRRAAFEKQSQLFIPLGVCAGCLPLVHTHSFLALGIISAGYLLRALRRGQSRDMLLGWLYYGLIAGALAAPQLFSFTFAQSGDFLKLHFNWGNETDSFLWFYIKNLGLLFVLLPLAYYRLPRKERAFYNGAALIWLLAEFIQFQPNPYDNNKLLFIWFAFTCGIVAKLLVELYAALAQLPGRRYIAACTLIVLFLSGILTLGRECVSDLEQFSADEVQAASFVQHNTQPDALFLTSNNHNNAVSSLTGRNIYCGTGSYLFFHGVDYEEREQQQRLLFEQPAQYFDTLRRQYGIDYVWISDYERYDFEIDEDFFSQFPIAYENDSVRILDTAQIA